MYHILIYRIYGNDAIIDDRIRMNRSGRGKDMRIEVVTRRVIVVNLTLQSIQVLSNLSGTHTGAIDSSVPSAAGATSTAQKNKLVLKLERKPDFLAMKKNKK